MYKLQRMRRLIKGKIKVKTVVHIARVSDSKRMQKTTQNREKATPKSLSPEIDQKAISMTLNQCLKTKISA